MKRKRIALQVKLLYNLSTSLLPRICFSITVCLYTYTQTGLAKSEANSIIWNYSKFFGESARMSFDETFAMCIAKNIMINTLFMVESWIRPFYLLSLCKISQTFSFDSLSLSTAFTIILTCRPLASHIVDKPVELSSTFGAAI